MKRKLTLWLAVVMAVISIGVASAIAEEAAPTEYTAFAMLNGEYALGDTLAWKTWEDMFNIHVEIESVLGADLTEKRNLVLASGEYPDIFIKAGLGMSDLTKYGTQGLFVPLEDLIRSGLRAYTCGAACGRAWAGVLSSIFPRSLALIRKRTKRPSSMAPPRCSA